MKKLSVVGIILIVGSVFLAGQLLAADVNPNGFPSGPHFNLNIIGKKDAFICPPPEFDAYGNQVYGNVIFVPETGTNIRILMESGRKGPKSAPSITTLQVTDWCTGFLAGDSATLRLPKNENGYRVYARVLAKPTDDPTMQINPGLDYVQDEFGTYLIFLGTVGFNSVTTSYGLNMVGRSKGKSTAIDITPIFGWTGDVCYVTDPGNIEYSAKPICGKDTSDPLDGTYDDFVSSPDGTTCPEGYTLITAYCKTYTGWVFNMADYVGYLWDLDNNGTKLLQVRFYPN
ncbi:MAG: hypothetical protein OEW45_21810 [Deltaproteobacteria bacterium]|nr:hypothetical protein [Deltaproteobacteria bacterium]